MSSAIKARSEPVSLPGWWQLVSSEVEFQKSGRRVPMYDRPARGYIVFAAEGRMMVVVEVRDDEAPAAGRTPVPGDRGMAYTGRYQVEGSRWVTQVDAASLPGWTGSVQERTFHIDGNQLHVCASWCISPLHGGQTVRAWLVWERLTAGVEATYDEAGND
jgi:hypothetical protein